VQVGAFRLIQARASRRAPWPSRVTKRLLGIRTEAARCRSGPSLSGDLARLLQASPWRGVPPATHLVLSGLPIVPSGVGRTVDWESESWSRRRVFEGSSPLLQAPPPAVEAVARSRSACTSGLWGARRSGNQALPPERPPALPSACEGLLRCCSKIRSWRRIICRAVRSRLLAAAASWLGDQLRRIAHQARSSTANQAKCGKSTAQWVRVFLGNNPNQPSAKVAVITRAPGGLKHLNHFAPLSGISIHAACARCHLQGHVLLGQEPQAPWRRTLTIGPSISTISTFFAAIRPIRSGAISSSTPLHVGDAWRARGS